MSKKSNTLLWVIGGAIAAYMLLPAKVRENIVYGGGGGGGYLTEGGHIPVINLLLPPEPGEGQIPAESDFVTLDYGGGVTDTMPRDIYERLIQALIDRPARLERFNDLIARREDFPLVGEFSYPYSSPEPLPPGIERFDTPVIMPENLTVIPETPGGWAPGEGAPEGMTLPTYEAQAAQIRALNPGMTATQSFTAVRVAQNTTSLGAKLQASAPMRAAGLTGVSLTSAMRAAGII